MTDPSAAVKPQRPPTRPGLRRGITVAAVVVVVAGAVAGGAWWLTHPAWFPAGGANEAVVTAPGKPLWVSVTDPEVTITPKTVHLDTVTAHKVSDTSAATITPYVCTNQPLSSRSAGMLGAGGTAMLRRLCRRVVPADNADMTVGRGHPEYVILKIVPRRPGRLRLDRVEVSYREGLQRGEQRIDFLLTLTARPAS